MSKVSDRPSLSSAAEPDREQDRQLSENTRLRLAVAELEKRLYELPVKIAFGALATLAGRLIVASHRTDEDRRRNNRHVFVHTVDSVIRLEEAKQTIEARIRRTVEKTVADRQRAEPLKTIDVEAVTREVRQSMSAEHTLENSLDDTGTTH